MNVGTSKLIKIDNEANEVVATAKVDKEPNGISYKK